MTLPLNNTFETGLADETGITAANSGNGSAGNAFDQVGIGGAGTAVYDTARAAHGALSGRFTQDGINDIYVRWSTSHGTEGETWGRFYIYLTAAPSGNFWFIRPQSGGSDCALAQWLAAGQLRLFDSTLGSAQTGAATIPVNEWVRFEYHLRNSPTVGVWEVKFFHADDVAPIETVSFPSPNTLTQTTQVQIGQTTNLAIGGDFWLDDIAVGANGWIGPARPPLLKFTKLSKKLLMGRP